MKARYRLRHNAEIRAVLREGKRVRQRLGVLYFRPNSLSHNRFCFSANKRVGNAVERNRAKRLLREAVRLRIHSITPSYDCVIMAHSNCVTASFAEVEAALLNLLTRAELLATQPDLLRIDEPVQ